MQDEKRFVGRIPAFAVTPEMLANPKLLMESPLFVSAEEIEAMPVSEPCSSCGFMYCECDEYD